MGLRGSPGTPTPSVGLRLIQDPGIRAANRYRAQRSRPVQLESEASASPAVAREKSREDLGHRAKILSGYW
jgi:hypothetical protein